MPTAILTITLGSILIFSALKGVSIADVLKGAAGAPLDPKGHQSKGSGSGGSSTSPPGGIAINSLTGGLKGVIGSVDPRFEELRGPKRVLLARLAKEGADRFNLTVSQICRPQNANYGAPGSNHKKCAAVDLSGKPADMMAFARFAKKSGARVFYDPAGWSAPGYDHTDHVHID